MSNRDYVNNILTEVFLFIRDHQEPSVEAMQRFSEVLNAILREACGEAYPPLPLKSGGKFYKKGAK